MLSSILSNQSIAHCCCSKNTIIILYYHYFSSFVYKFYLISIFLSYFNVKFNSLSQKNVGRYFYIVTNDDDGFVFIWNLFKISNKLYFL